MNQYKYFDTSKKILITGAAGFIGANFIKYMLAEHQDIKIVVLDLQ